MSEAEHPYRSIWTHMMTVPFRQDWLDADGIRTRYVQAGRSDAPALIMLHGTAGTWECFAGNIGAHAAHFNCYAFDMIGSGFTSKPDRDYEIADYVAHVRAFMRAAGIARAAVIGVSLGAWVAARLAVDHPDLVDSLTLLAASGLVANAQTMGAIRSARTRAVEDPSWDTISAIFVPLIHDAHNRIPDLVAVRQATYRLPEMKMAMPHILCLQDSAIRPRNLIDEAEWRAIAAPALVIAAPDDKPDYYETAHRVAALMRDATLVEMPGVKHWGQFEKPDEFNRLSLDFLRRKTGVLESPTA